MGTLQATSSMEEIRSYVSQLTLLVALPMRNTLYRSRFVGPLRAPTMRSVSETVLRKLVWVSLRILSTPSSSVTLRAIDTTVSSRLVRRKRALFNAMRSRVSARPPSRVQLRGAR